MSVCAFVAVGGLVVGWLAAVANRGCTHRVAGGGATCSGVGGAATRATDGGAKPVKPLNQR